MNVLIGWILLLITMSVFITFVFGYDLDLKRKYQEEYDSLIH